MEEKKYDSQFEKLAHTRFPMVRELMSGIQEVLRMQTFPANERLRFGYAKVRSFDGYQIPVTVLCPEGSVKDAECLIYYHGGGFVLPSDISVYRAVEKYAIEVGCRVVFPDYRLAPEYIYPTQHEDSYTVYKWVYDNAATLGIDPAKIAVGGESAGGNLAAAVCQMARDRGVQVPCFQMLLYPVTDRRMITESSQRIVDAPVWDRKHSEIMWQWLTPHVAPGEFCYASPMEAESLEGLPDAYVETCDYDSLHDEGEAYARALKEAGSKVEYHFIEGTVHGFEMAGDTPIVIESIKRRCQALKAAFEGTAR